MSSYASATEAQNKAALEHFIKLPVSREMVNYLAQKATEVIHCEPQAPPPMNHSLPTPPLTPTNDSPLPSVEDFIISLVEHSHVQVNTLMTSLVYLHRLQQRLPPVAKGMRCTVHRIFLASLILAAKYLNDSSPKNKHWARYTSVPGYEQFGFANSEINLMEKQLLYLLGWDLRITNQDLYQHLDYFLEPIRQWQEQQAKQVMENMVREREIKAMQEKHIAQALQHSHRGIGVYDSPRSIYSSTEDHYSRPRPYYTTSSSRLPSRTPSLSPPNRCDSPLSAYTESLGTASRSPSPARAASIERYEPVHINTYDVSDLPSIVHIRATPQKAPIPTQHSHLALPEERTAKKLRSSASGFFTRILGTAGMYSRPQQQHVQSVAATAC